MRAYFVSPIPYLLFIATAVWVTYYVFERRMFFVLRQADLDTLFENLPWVFVVVAPALAMRLWSEETRGGTLETLLTFPVRTRHLALGKFLAAWTMVAVCLASTLGLVVTVSWLGDLDAGPAIGGYLGAMLLGGCFLSLGQWLSGLTRNQIVAFLLAVIACTVLGRALEMVGDSFSGAIGDVASSLSLSARFRAIGRGVVDLRDVAYFVSFIGFFLYLNVESIENRRYR
jgi:ABC-2 type transport system permease protein